MTNSESERAKGSLITGAVCPQCGQRRSRKLSTESYELKCCFCGHRWNPKSPESR